jgi:glucosyl-3-phosphoglycerate synthase
MKHLARTGGRGMESAPDWFEERSFHWRDFAGLAEPGPAGARPPATVSLVLPARNVAETIGPILDQITRLNARRGLVDQVIVVDADSADGTAAIARERGAEVYSENELMPEYGVTRGKGDAMWRSLSVARGDIVMFADADTKHFGEHFVYGTLGPLLAMPGLRFTKAAYRRPFTDTPVPVADGGGRVTELMAKPLFNFFCPELTGFVQPLAGEFAAYRELLCKIPFLTGYGVELGILVDVLREIGLSEMAQVDLGIRHNRHQPLWDLARMSYTVLRAMMRRMDVPDRGAPVPDVPGIWPLRPSDVYLHAVAAEEGLQLDAYPDELLERPPMAEVLAADRDRDTVA